jgi:IS5 family transposase
MRDAGYTCVAMRDEFEDKIVTWQVAEKRGKLKKMAKSPRKHLVTQFERTEAQIRAKDGASVSRVKNLFRHQKVRYRWLSKGTAQLFKLFALGNLIHACRINPSQSACFKL